LHLCIHTYSMGMSCNTLILDQLIYINY